MIIEDTIQGYVCSNRRDRRARAASVQCAHMVPEETDCVELVGGRLDKEKAS